MLFYNNTHKYTPLIIIITSEIMFFTTFAYRDTRVTKLDATSRQHEANRHGNHVLSVGGERQGRVICFQQRILGPSRWRIPLRDVRPGGRVGGVHGPTRVLSRRHQSPEPDGHKVDPSGTCQPAPDRLRADRHRLRHRRRS